MAQKDRHAVKSPPTTSGVRRRPEMTHGDTRDGSPDDQERSPSWWRGLTTEEVRLSRLTYAAMLGLSAVGLGATVMYVGDTLFPVEDPTSTTVGAGADAREIDAKATIVAECPDVDEVQELSWPYPWVQIGGRHYQQWIIEDIDEYTRVALLDVDTGAVTCPGRP
jgi:hypothetical protein